jgi:hypothetical protein
MLRKVTRWLVRPKTEEQLIIERTRALREHIRKLSER